MFADAAWIQFLSTDLFILRSSSDFSRNHLHGTTLKFVSLLKTLFFHRYQYNREKLSLL